MGQESSQEGAAVFLYLVKTMLYKCVFLGMF